MHRERSNLVRVGRARFAIHPADERQEPGLVGRVGQKIHEPRDPAARLLGMTIHRVSGRLAITHERPDVVTDVRRLDVFPVQICGITADGERKLAAARAPRAA